MIVEDSISNNEYHNPSVLRTVIYQAKTLIG